MMLGKLYLVVVKTYFYSKLKLTTPKLQSESNKSGTFFVNWFWESREDIILAESNNWDTKRHTHKLQQHSLVLGFAQDTCLGLL